MNAPCDICFGPGRALLFDLQDVDIDRQSCVEVVMGCPACGEGTGKCTATGVIHWHRVECTRCGTYEITDTAKASDEWRFTPEEQQWVPHTLRLMQQSGSIPRLKTDDLVALKKTLRRPTPSEAADNLVKYLSRERRLGHYTNVGTDQSLPNVIGVPTSKGVRYLAEELEKKGWVNIDRTSNSSGNPENLLADLTFSGWERCEALLRGAHSGRFAFMALKFDDAELNQLVDSCFRPSVDETGFELRLLNDREHQRAGLIDDRLRIELKGARFLLVDLTHQNNGAYWEAGYGEGLGKPVIYTCKRTVFDDRRKQGGGTHFDTNHHLHILWDVGELGATGEELKACIRATIPEAKRDALGTSG